MKYKIGAGIICSIIFISICIHLYTYRKVENYTVASIGWNTQIDIQQYLTNHEGGWSIPYGGKETNHYTKQRGTTRYIAGYKSTTHKGSCVGTGAKKRCSSDTTTSEPIYKTRAVYDTWYEYDIDRWINIQPLKASGIGHKWYYPDTSDGTYNTAPIIGNKRLGAEHTQFFIIFRNNNQQKQVDMPIERWNTINMNDTYEITSNWFGMIVNIKQVGVW